MGEDGGLDHLKVDVGMIVRFNLFLLTLQLRSLVGQPNQGYFSSL